MSRTIVHCFVVCRLNVAARGGVISQHGCFSDRSLSRSRLTRSLFMFVPKIHTHSTCGPSHPTASPRCYTRSGALPYLLAEQERALLVGRPPSLYSQLCRRRRGAGNGCSASVRAAASTSTGIPELFSAGLTPPRKVDGSLYHQAESRVGKTRASYK